MEIGVSDCIFTESIDACSVHPPQIARTEPLPSVRAREQVSLGTDFVIVEFSPDDAKHLKEAYSTQ